MEETGGEGQDGQRLVMKNTSFSPRALAVSSHGLCNLEEGRHFPPSLSFVIC